MSEDERRAQGPDGMPAGAPDDGDAADVTAHSAAGPRAGRKADRLIDSRDLHDLAIKWSLIHGPGALPGVIQSTCTPALAGKRHAFRCATSGSESRYTPHYVVPQMPPAMAMAWAAGEPEPPAVAEDDGPSPQSARPLSPPVIIVC